MTVQLENAISAAAEMFSGRTEFGKDEMLALRNVCKGIAFMTIGQPYQYGWLTIYTEVKKLLGIEGEY